MENKDYVWVKINRIFLCIISCFQLKDTQKMRAFVGRVQDDCAMWRQQQVLVGVSKLRIWLSSQRPRGFCRRSDAWWRVMQQWITGFEAPGCAYALIGVGQIKKAGSYPGLQSQVHYSVRCHMLCLKAVGGCQHATPPVHPTTPNRAEDWILFAASDGPQHNGIFHTLPPWFWWLRTKKLRK